MADDEYQALVDRWGEEDVQAAFWLQRHIKNHGLDGIGYMEVARGRLRSTGEFTVQKKMEAQMDNNY